MKKILLLAAIGVTSLTFGSAVKAQGIRIEVGDRPYYSHGPHYWAGDHEMIWVAGHWTDHHHTFVHGHYIRGEHRRHDFERHNDEQRNDYRDDSRR